MDKQWTAIITIALLMLFSLGFWSSYESGIQPGYFEKAEAPAYGVGGGTMVKGLTEEAEEHFKKLYEEEE